MRERHRARVCRHCEAPMARQVDACWRCGIEWAPEEEPRTTLRLILGGALRETDAADRWTNEGGSFASEVTAPLRANTGERR
jgi:hypothetical protein